MKESIKKKYEERATVRRRVWMKHNDALMLGHTVEINPSQLTVDLDLEPKVGSVWTVPFALSKSVQLKLRLKVIRNSLVFGGRKVLTTFKILKPRANSMHLFKAWLKGKFEQLKPRVPNNKTAKAS